MDVDYAGDGYCDDRFNCQKLGYDWGDCMIVKDCDDVEFSSLEVALLLGDGECHSGQSNYPHLSCERFEYDEGDCTKPVLIMQTSLSHAMQLPHFTTFYSMMLLVIIAIIYCDRW